MLLTFEIHTTKILSTEERIQEILNNKHIHPWYKHLRIARIYRQQAEMLKWTIEEDQDILHLHGIDVDAKLNNGTLQAIKAECQGHPEQKRVDKRIRATRRKILEKKKLKSNKKG